MKSGEKQNFFMSEKVNLRKKALCSTSIQNRNVDVHCVHEKLFISPILLHFPDTSENGIAYFFEKKRSFNNVLVFWQHLGLSGYQILFTDTTNYVLCNSPTISCSRTCTYCGVVYVQSIYIGNLCLVIYSKMQNLLFI